MNTLQSNPLAENRNGGALIDTESQRAIQEVQASLIIAKRFPRDEKKCLDNILNACSRPGLAEMSVYTYARGGTDISGPSIRLAEAVAQRWGNLQFGIRELEQSNGVSTVEAFAWDVESNTRQTKIFQVVHERHTRQGARMLTDPRDIYELVANNGARRLRACILGVIPGDIIEEAVNQCELTMRTSADTSPEAQKKMVEALSTYGVSKSQIETRIQRRLDAITPAQVVSMKKIYASLRDGMSSTEDWFEKESEGIAKREKPNIPGKPKATEEKGAVENSNPVKHEATGRQKKDRHERDAKFKGITERHSDSGKTWFDVSVVISGKVITLTTFSTTFAESLRELEVGTMLRVTVTQSGEGFALEDYKIIEEEGLV